VIALRRKRRVVYELESKTRTWHCELS
ncbi:hypothetical protein LSAT2_010095, partial [Lamellibrachia satsuma]